MKTGKDGISDIISVFNMYEQKMYHIAYAILRDSYQAEDAVMDAFVRLLERQYSIEDPAANATKRLIIQVTRSAAIDLYRKNSKETERQTLVDDPSALRSSGQKDAFTFEAGDLESMLQHLPQIYRDVLYCNIGMCFTAAMSESFRPKKLQMNSASAKVPSAKERSGGCRCCGSEWINVNAAVRSFSVRF